jgi:hypothetical protein
VLTRSGYTSSLDQSNHDGENKVDLSEAVSNALYFGHGREGIRSGIGEQCRDGEVEVFVVFPHLKRDIRQDIGLLQKWQEKVVKPGYKEAWKKTETAARGTGFKMYRFDLYHRVAINQIRDGRGLYDADYGMDAGSEIAATI